MERLATASDVAILRLILPEALDDFEALYDVYRKAVVILLCGGDQSSQTADINRAKAFWLEWKQRQT